VVAVGPVVGVGPVLAVGLVVVAVVLTRFAAQPTWTPLFSNLSGGDANAVVEQLKTQGVQYQLSNGGSTVLVPQSQVYDLRVALAGKNLPAGDSGGWSLLDQQGMTSTDFQQNVAYQRAMEGELGKTLQAMTGVQTAIVHLAIPKKDVFTSDTDVPTASVLLALKPGATVAQGQVRSVMHLVAGSVPGLKPSDVTVTDAAGKMLSTREDGAAGAAGDDRAAPIRSGQAGRRRARRGRGPAADRPRPDRRPRRGPRRRHRGLPPQTFRLPRAPGPRTGTHEA